MRDFVDELDRRLAEAAAATLLAGEPTQRPLHQVVLPAPPVVAGSEPVAEPPGTKPRPSAPRRRRRPTILGGLVATGTMLASGFLLSGTSAAGLPILTTQTTDASGLRSVPALHAAQVDFSRAHAFLTRGGPGYVLADRAGQKLCVSLPDPAAPGRYAGTCAALSTAERDGLLLEVVGDRSVNRAARNDAVFVLPEDARDVQVQTETSPARGGDVQDGVVALSMDAPATISFEAAGRPRRVRVLGPFEAGAAFCDRGRSAAPPRNADEGAKPSVGTALPPEAICP